MKSLDEQANQRLPEERSLFSEIRRQMRMLESCSDAVLRGLCDPSGMTQETFEKCLAVSAEMEWWDDYFRLSEQFPEMADEYERKRGKRLER